MSRPDRWLVTLLLPLAGIAWIHAADPAADPRSQAAIAEAVSAVARQEPEASARLESLRALGRDARGPLLLQLAIFLRDATGTEQSMAGALVFHELRFTPREKLDAIVPGLDAAGPEMRRVLTEMLSTVDRPQGGEPDFRVYEETIRARGDSPPEGLILYMCGVSPEATLESLERVYGGASPRSPAASGALTTLRASLSESKRTGSVDATAKARAALDTIGRDPAWWRRLYAASVLRAHPELAGEVLISRLTRDPHPLVRRAAQAQRAD
jgi:hypothetical protein